MKRLLLASALVIACLPFAVRAESPPTVFVSEVGWAGSSASTADEWLELFNPSDADVPIGGWTIDGAATGDTALKLPAAATIAADSTFLIANYAETDAHSTLAAHPDFVTTAVALSNSSLHLILRDAEGNMIDEVGSASAAPAAGASGTQKTSMERVLPLLPGNEKDAWRSATSSLGFDPGATERGTPGFFDWVAPVATTADDAPASDAVPADASVSASDTAVQADALPSDTDPAASVAPAEVSGDGIGLPTSAVRISEVYPSPRASEHEWIELTDPSGQGEILDGWSIEDARGMATPLAGLLPPWSRAVIDAPKGALNNDGDMVILKDAYGRVVDAVSYGAAERFGVEHAAEPRRGESLIRLELSDTYAVTATPTPGEPNVLTGRAASKAVPKKAAAVRPAVTPAAMRVFASAFPPGQVVSIAESATDEPPAVVAEAPSPKPLPRLASRYKGTAMHGVVAVPPGVYGKTKMLVLADGALREVRLDGRPRLPLASGDIIRFVGREKTDGEAAYIAVNPKTLAKKGAGAAPSYEPSDGWPDRSGAFEVRGTVAAVAGGRLKLRAGGREGEVVLPPGMAKTPLQEGDEVVARGFVAAEDPPRIYVPDAGSLTLFKAYRAQADATGVQTPPAKLPWTAAAGLTGAVFAIGLLAYLRHERMKRLALMQRMPMDEEIDD